MNEFLANVFAEAIEYGFQFRRGDGYGAGNYGSVYSFERGHTGTGKPKDMLVYMTRLELMLLLLV